HAAEERDQRRRHRDQHGVPHPLVEERLLHQVLDVVEGRVGGPERRVERMVPGPVELAVRAYGGHRHPVEREQQAEDEHRHRQVEPQPLLPACALDHRLIYLFSTRRMYQSWKITTKRSAGNMASEMAAPSLRSPVPMPI